MATSTRTRDVSKGKPRGDAKRPASSSRFLARVPVFMYGTDFREAALKDVIESLHPQLFERVTGLTIEDFELLSELGLFHARNMEAAIWQFRQFERELALCGRGATGIPCQRPTIGSARGFEGVLLGAELRYRTIFLSWWARESVLSPMVGTS